MNKRRRDRAVLFLGTVCLLIVGAGGWWLQSARRQEALNRQLIASLVHDETYQALVLVENGADPNTHCVPLPSPSLSQLWNWLVHRTEMPSNGTSRAFAIACGAQITYGDSGTTASDWDDPHLVETMLQHGAQKNVTDTNEWTPLMWSHWSARPKTFAVLLKYGVDVNAQDPDGCTVLFRILKFPDPSEPSRETDLIRQLLAYGANPNLPDKEGGTPLKLAQQNKRPDLVALLKQAGAKK